MKTPEEYFQENVRLPEEGSGQGEPTPAEKAFMEKYMGMGGAPVLSEVRRYDPSEKDSLPGFAKADGSYSLSGLGPIHQKQSKLFNLWDGSNNMNKKQIRKEVEDKY